MVQAIFSYPFLFVLQKLHMASRVILYLKYVLDLKTIFLLHIAHLIYIFWSHFFSLFQKSLSLLILKWFFYLSLVLYVGFFGTRLRDSFFNFDLFGKILLSIASSLLFL